MSNIKSIKDRMDRKQAVNILEGMCANLTEHTHATMTKVAALEIAIDFIKGNWKDAHKEQPEQYTHVTIWDNEIQAIGEAYWDGDNFYWVCDEEVAHPTLWKEYEVPLNQKEGN